MKKIASILKALKQSKRDRKSESGNVLFLILIAVALFAALSYAVTSSSRSGGGDASSETNLVSSASITQYPASVRTTLIRMLINGATADFLAFNPPPYTTLDTSSADVLEVAVFHPTGGGAVYSPASRDFMTATNPDGDWFFNANMELENVGIAGAGGADVIAYLPGVTRSICEKINVELGITTKSAPTTPVLDADNDARYRTNMLDDDTNSTTVVTNFPTTAGDVLDDVAGASNVFAGEPYGCFQNGGTGGGTNQEYVYFHVLIEQ